MNFPHFKPQSLNLSNKGPKISVARAFGSQGFGQTVTQQIKRGETYTQLKPRPGLEKYKIFVATFWPTANPPFQAGPLTSTSSAPYTDVETFLPMPYTVPAGIASDFREWFFGSSGKAALSLSLDNIPIFYLVVNAEMVHQYEQIVWGTTLNTDPNMLLPHTWNATITNIDTVNITGTFHISLYLTSPTVNAILGP